MERQIGFKVFGLTYGMSIFRQGQGVKEEHGDVAALRRTRDDADNAEIGKKRHSSYLSPRTSCISYSPGAFPTTHWAARTEPRENMSRVMARWLISIRSPMPMK